MTIHSGTSARYYRCSDAKKRGTCANKQALREDTARRAILTALGERYRSPAAISYLRRKVAERLGELSREANSELQERRERLQRTEERLAGLITFVANGDQSDYVRKAIVDLEAQAKTEKAAIADLRAASSKPIELPSPDAIVERSLDLERIIATDPVRGRERLRRLFEGGQLALVPEGDGAYRAEGRLFPLGLLLESGGPDKSQSCGPALVARGGIEPPTFGL